MKYYCGKFCAAVASLASLALCAQAQAVTPTTMNLTDMQDAARVLSNPDKGWYHHYYDNSLKKYLGKDEDIAKIPNMQHMFLRFAWSFLEPEEGKFNWALIDDIVERWKPRGSQISLSITCQETGEPFATPRWVIDAGAKGAMYKQGGNHSVFEPDFNDPIFLEKLDNLQKAIAKRYDGKDFIASITVASIGNWGEGHTHFTSKTKIPVEVIKKHIDIYAKHFKKSLLVIGDDYLAAKHTPEEILELRQYVKERKISYRDDSILVKWTYFHNPSRLSFLNPEFFDDAAEYAPTTLELEHYAATLESGSWKGKNGVEHGADVLRKVVDRSHCTYLGYHGYAADYLRDNPDIVNELANKVGYWLFINEVVFDPSAGKIKFVWDNRGAARPYKRYKLSIKLKNSESGETFVVPIPDADSRTLEKGISEQTYGFNLPEGLKGGKYELSVRLYKSSPKSYARPIEFGFKESLRDADGFFKIGEVAID